MLLALLVCACTDDSDAGPSGGSGGPNQGGAGGAGATGSGATSSGATGSGATGGQGDPVIPPAPSAGERLFIPRIVADDGTSRIWNYRQKSTPFWFGRVDSRNNYTEGRVGYSDELLMLRFAVFDQKIYDDCPDVNTGDWDSITLLFDLDGSADKTALDERSYRIDAQAGRHGTNVNVLYRGSAGGWQRQNTSVGSDPEAAPDGLNVQKAYRGAERDQSRGWANTFYLGWKALGFTGAPLSTAAERTLRVAVISYDRDDANGSLRGEPQGWPSAAVDQENPSTWGTFELLPAHYLSWNESGAGPAVPKPAYAIGYEPKPFVQGSEQTVKIRHGLGDVVVENAAVGSSGVLCSGDDSYNFGDGVESFGGNTERSYFHVQNQEDFADWPCFAKIYVKFPLASVPANKTLVSARLVLHHAMPTSGGDEGARSLIQAFPVANTLQDGTTSWTGANITWNNAPWPFENAAGVWGDRAGQELGWDKLPEWSWDVSRAVSRMLEAGQTHASFALSSADQEYHTGKQFVHSADFPDWGDQDQRPRLDVVVADAQ
jgi:hypothetical protein